MSNSEVGTLHWEACEDCRHAVGIARDCQKDPPGLDFYTYPDALLCLDYEKAESRKAAEGAEKGGAG